MTAGLLRLVDLQQHQQVVHHHAENVIINLWHGVCVTIYLLENFAFALLDEGPPIAEIIRPGGRK